MADDLTRVLDTLEARLPQMIVDNPDPADFWPAFACEADAIEDGADDRVTEMQERIQQMLAAHGCYLVTV